jgi:hypothetical protein
MTSNFRTATTGAVGEANLFPPSLSVLPTPAATQQLPGVMQRVAAVPGLSRAEVRAADATAMAGTLQGLWAAMTNRPVEDLFDGEMHPDGTPRFNSQVAVWLIGQISEVYGRRLVNLSAVKDPETIRSLGGLSRLLVGAIRADAKRTAA